MATATAPTVPDWLKTRDGALKPGVRPETVFVMVSDCAVSTPATGTRLDDEKTTYPTADAALAGGLDQLRNVLGW